jgi:hypothetical protein
MRTSAVVKGTIAICGVYLIIADPTAVAAPATLEGRVVNSWSCPGGNSCTGVPGVTVLVLSSRKPSDAIGTTCSPPPKDLLARTVTDMQGRFSISSLRRNDGVRSVYCMLGYVPHPSPPQNHQLTEATTTVTVQLFKEIEGDADAKQAAQWLSERLVKQQNRGRPLAQLYEQEWQGLASQGLSIESRAKLARHLVGTGQKNIREARWLQAYASLEPGTLASLRSSIKTAVQSGEPADSVVGKFKDKVGALLLSEVFLDEYRKRPSHRSDMAWQALGNDLGVAGHKRPVGAAKDLTYDAMGASTF